MVFLALRAKAAPTAESPFFSAVDLAGRHRAEQFPARAVEALICICLIGAKSLGLVLTAEPASSWTMSGRLLSLSADQGPDQASRASFQYDQQSGHP
jgi:hypothetical protein